MSSEEDISPNSDLDEWERLLDEQTVLFRRTSSQNKDLQVRVEELERELSVWKSALKATDEEKKQLQRSVVKLERNIGSLKDDNPLILCLIDGDGTIFSSDLISLGQVGGHQAASLLTKGLTDHLADVEESARGQIWLTVYCNKAGLLETLMANGACTPEQFESFVTGFNQASPLFSFVDVGSGKERADEKIKECLRVFTRFPQITKVFFGGAHDNGYASTLNYLQNEGHLHKVIVLRGYKELAFEIRNLNLPSLQIDSLFHKKRLQSLAKSSSSSTNKGASSSKKAPPATIQAQDFEKFRNKTSPPSSVPRSKTTSGNGSRSLDPNVPLHRQKPPPCNFFYLADCKHGSGCRYGHDYYLQPYHIEELRENSPKWPCPFVNRAHMHDRSSSGKTSHSGSRSRSSASSPPDGGSPAGIAFSSTLPTATSPMPGSPTSTSAYSFSMGSDGRPLFTPGSSSSRSGLLSRIARRVEEYEDDDEEVIL
ncbi:hypothetical protein EIP91_008884 [Steccherinum ochraceum]|uniref:C3H1-type domain-containing protein n=1 Tax=Steccherinum ochraceum TaxID=92696 RepID=A0A4R0RV72_9APHY|nr:hypothetical protein EIP91_008884 [Steccherinum ochraceum]